VKKYSLNTVQPDFTQLLSEDSERVFCRAWCLNDDGSRSAVLAVLPAKEYPSRLILDRLAHEYALKNELDRSWAVRPLELLRDGGRTMLVLEDPGGEPLERLLGTPMAMARFLHLGIGIASALRKLHARGLVHKDIKPANIILNDATGEVRLTGFGIASRLSRERQAAKPPEALNGTLAYMAPEQTGRMNRSIDSRSDLYALGVTFYQMLTGALPFTAADPMEWVHCHLAKQPVAPADRVKEIPDAVLAIIMKLLAKAAEDRYQTAAGLERDLRSCRTEWETRRRIDDFPLGEHDTPDRLLIPEKLYGRRREVETLLASFDHIINGGAPELVLVFGYSGVGKSSVVNELNKALVQPRGLFASGKFDQYKRDIPYSTLAQAFQSLVRDLLAKSGADLAAWCDALREALGANGQLMVDLVPELNLIIGQQPPVAELPPQQAQGRFQVVLRRFIGVFARPEHPLALFLDDLQWLDTATLDLLENLLTQPGGECLLVVGAYRDNEVDPTHPLTRKLDAIRKARAPVREVRLAPLVRDVVEQLVADTLRCEPAHSAPLSQLVHEKTTGNPFFLIQFLRAIAEEGLLTFEHDQERWSWDLDRIRTKGYTDNVADLLVGKLSQLPVETQNALRWLTCLGVSADVTTLSLLLGRSEEQIHADLWDAVRQEFVERSAGAYRFIHDRVQEAAYSLIPEDRRAEAHLRIGRLLLAHTPPEQKEEAIFQIVNQLNRGAAMITARDEREQLAELNLLAGKRAKASAAYAAAQAHIAAGCALLPEDCWEQCSALTFSLELNLAECEFLIGALAAAENRLAMLSSRVGGLVELAAVTCLRLSLYTTLDRTDRAVEVCLDCLRRVGIQWSAHPTNDEVRQEYERIWQQIGGRQIEELADLPLMTNPECCAILDVLAAVQTPALFTDENLLCLVVSRMTNLSLEHGNSDGSCLAYVWVGSVIAGPRFGDYEAGFRFGRLGYDLVEQRGLKRFQSRTYMNFGNVLIPWTRHVRAGRDPLRRAFEAANQSGDMNFAAFCCNQLNTNLLAAGDPLDEVQGETEWGLAFARKMRFGLVIDAITGQLGLIRTLRGLTTAFGSFDEEGFNELVFEHHLENNPALALAEARYWVRKLQARFFAGAYASAIVAAAKAERLLWTSRTVFERAEYHFYAALARGALCDATSAAERAQYLEALAVDYRLLQGWADNCPENFANRAALVAAEIARLEGRELDSERLYEEAIRSARVNGFVHNEALAYELAARFHMGRGFEEIARLYLRNARQGYLRWGADGKVRQLDQLHPWLRQEGSAPGPAGTLAAPVEHLDLATVLKVSQAISSEIVQEKLLEILLRTALEQAGAERGVLILSRRTEPRIAAQATTGGDGIVVQLDDQTVTAAVLPESLIQYVMHTNESVILDDAAAQNPFSADAYIRQHHARSILCMPLLNQGKLMGVLYLENNLTPQVFTSARLAVLKLLASQAAISLENARLYRDLKEREVKIRRLVDSNIIGIFIWDFEGQILEANEAFLHMVGYDHEELVAGRIRWTDLTPPDWRESEARWIQEHKRTGSLQPLEKEYLRKDGSRVPVLIGVATFEEGGNQGVAFVLDMTERKRAEEALHESEHKLRQIIETVPSMLWSTAPDGQPIHINQRVLDYSGLRLENFLNLGWKEFLHPEDFPETARAFYGSIQTGEPYEAVHRLRRVDGQYRWHHARGEPLRDKQGRIVQWYGLSIDIDERMKAEERLRRSEAYLAEAQRLSHSGVSAHNGKAIHYASEETYRIWGFDPAQGVPSLDAARERIHPDDRDRMRAKILHALSEKREYSIAYRIVLPDGTIKQLESIGRPAFAASGELVEIVTTQIDVTDRKRAVEALQRSEFYLSEGQRIARIGSWAFNPLGFFEYWSQELFQIYGLDPEKGAPTLERYLDTVHPLDRDSMAETIRRMRTERSGCDVKKRIVRPDGELRYIRCVGVPVIEDEFLKGFLGTAMDITEQELLTQELRESEGRFRDYAETASDWFWEIGPDYKFTMLSDNAYGSGVPDLIGKAYWDNALDLETEPEKWRLVWETLDSRKPFRDFVHRSSRRDDTSMYVRASGRPVFGANGEFCGYRGTGTDVTALMNAQEALRESERSLRSAIDGIAGLVAILAPKGEVETVNRQLSEYFGRPLQWIKDWATNDAVHPEDLPGVLEISTRGITSGIAFSQEFRIRRFDGEYRSFEARAVPVSHDFGRIARWYVLLVDIEDRTRALVRLDQMRSDLAHMNRVSVMGELAASLSHEITQPIASARNNARAAQNFMNRQPPDLGEVREAISCVMGDTDRAGEIVDRIRDHIKKAPPRKEHFDLNEAINEVILLPRSAINKNGVSVQTRLSEGLSPIYGDRVQLQQVVLNLIMNAVEAMGLLEAEPRELLITTEQDHTGVLVTVRDSGPGIDPTHLERVFNAFYTTKSHGVGMGLSICRSIIDEHGGRLWVEANEPRGAVFQLTLPKAETS
jgi:PAS domain S-box-containing protein